MWNHIWHWIISNHIYNAFVVLAVTVLVFFPGRLKSFFGRFKRVKLGPIDLEADHDIDPNTPCPYRKERELTSSMFSEINDKISNLARDIERNHSIIKRVYIDQQKQVFYDKDQPSPERLASGLRYIYEGENGDTKKDVIAFANEHPDIYKGIISARPELKLDDKH